MISKTERKMLESRMFFTENVTCLKEVEDNVIVNSGGSIFSIDKDLYDRYNSYMSEKNILLTSDDEYSLGQVKLTIYEKNISYDYHSNGYLITQKDFEEQESTILEIPFVEYFMVK